MSGWAIAADTALKIGGAAWDAKTNRQNMREQMQKSHLYEMRDLKAAGLNPVLTATGGKGATGSPSGAGGMSKVNIASAYLMSKQAELAEAQAEKVKAETVTEGERTSLIINQANQAMNKAGLTNEEISLIEPRYRKLIAEASNIGAQKHGSQAKSDMLQQEADLYAAIAEMVGDLGAPSSAKAAASRSGTLASKLYIILKKLLNRRK